MKQFTSNTHLQGFLHYIKPHYIFPGFGIITMSSVAGSSCSYAELVEVKSSSTLIFKVDNILKRIDDAEAKNEENISIISPTYQVPFPSSDAISANSLVWEGALDLHIKQKDSKFVGLFIKSYSEMEVLISAVFHFGNTQVYTFGKSELFTQTGLNSWGRIQLIEGYKMKNYVCLLYTSPSPRD